MLHPIRSRRPGRPATDSRANTPTPFARRLRVEPLEDRRMLSVTLFVDADAAPGGDGLAWETAYTDLQSALNSAAALNADAAAENDVDAIWIAEGTYLPSVELEPGVARSVSFSLVDGVTLYGGFEGTEESLEERDPSAFETVLSGDLGVEGDVSDNAYTVVYCGEGVEAVVDGVTVTGGNCDAEGSDAPRPSRFGGGIFNSGDLTVANSLVTGNRGGSYTASLCGGAGAYNYQGDLRLVDSEFSRNFMNARFGKGGAIHNTGGTIEMIGCLVTQNRCSYWGGGIDSYDGEVYVRDSTFAGNYAGSGGAIFIYDRDVLSIVNSVFVGNRASGGGALFTSGICTVTNSTFAGNSASWRGGGIYTDFGEFSDLNINNTIVALNESSTGPDIYGSTGTVTGAYNFIGDGRVSKLVNDDDGSGDHNQVGMTGELTSSINPLFFRAPGPGRDGTWGTADDECGDLRLRGDSSALDAGSDLLAVDADAIPLTSDILGNPRIQCAGVDIGAYETGAGVYVSAAKWYEGDGPGIEREFALFVCPPQSTDITVDYATADGTAISGQDYTADSGTVVIPAGQSDASVTVAVHGDTVRDDDREFFLLLSNSSGPAVIDSQTPGTIVDDDGQTYVIDSLEDVVASDGFITLREAIEAANANAPVEDAPPGFAGVHRDRIVFDPSLFSDAPAVITLGGSELSITDDVVIAGPGADLLTVDASGRSRVLSVQGAIGVTLKDITLTGGFSEDNGGGVLLQESNFTIVNSKIQGNATSADGGGVYNSGYPREGAIRVINSTISANTADGYGGGIYCSGSSVSSALALTNATVTANSAHIGGGIYWADESQAPRLSLNNSLIAKNTAASGPDLHCDNAAVSGVNNLIADGSFCSFVHDDDGDPDAGTNNMVGTAEAPIDPLFFRDPNPGPDGTWHTEDDDYGNLYLQSDSPAIDAGAIDLARDADGIPLHVDLSGNPRIDEAGRVDIGAYETPCGILVLTTLVDEGDAISSMEFTVLLHPAQEDDTHVQYATADFTATAGVDYTATSGTLTIPAGETSGAIEVEILGNTVLEPDRAFLLNLSTTSDLALIDSQVQGVILDDEGQTYQVNSLEDTVALDGAVTLREAIEAANGNVAVGDAPAGFGGFRRDRIFVTVHAGFQGRDYHRGRRGHREERYVFSAAWTD